MLKFTKNIDHKTVTVLKDDKVKDMSKLITLVFHSVRFPDPSLPNKPEFFNVPDVSKNVMSFGRIKLFNDDVLTEVFGSKTDNPLYEMRLIRSRLQAFIDQFTFSYMNGLGNALPDAALVAFRTIVDDLAVEFELQQAKYQDRYPQLKEASKAYFGAKPELYHGVTSSEMKAAIEAKLNSYSYSIEDKFLFQVTHFEVKPVEMEMTQSDIAEKQVQIEARNEIAKKAGADFGKMINEFQATVRKDLRDSAVKAFEDLLNSINEEKWNQKSINAVLKYCDKFKKLNFLNDKELEKFLDKQKEALNTISAQEVKKTDGSVSSFQGMVSESVGELKKMANEEKQAFKDSFGSMGKRTFDPF